MIPLFLHGSDLVQWVKCSVRNMPDAIVVQGEDIQTPQPGERLLIHAGDVVCV